MATDHTSPERREHWASFMESLHPHGDPQAARLMEEFWQTSHRIRQLNEASLENAGLSYAQYRILLGLMFREWQGEREGVNPSAISAQQGTSRNTISSLIRSLEDQGLVERQLDPDDKRRFKILLTGAGRHKIHEQASRHVQMIGRLFSVLTPQERDTLSSLLHVINQHASALKE